MRKLSMTFATLMAWVLILTFQDLPGPLDDWWGDITGIGDSTPPTVTITSAPGGTDSSTTATFVWTADDPDATFFCSLNGSTPASCTSGKQYTTVSSPALAADANNFTLYAKDPSGNRSDDAVHIWNRSFAEAFTCPAGATDINPGQDVDAIINGQNSDGGAADVFCINDSATPYTVSQTITLGTNDDIYGEYADQSRPTLDGGNVPQVIKTSNASGAFIENIAVTGAQYTNSTDCPSTSIAVCGRGIGGGGSNVHVTNVNSHNNGNQGIGGMGANFLGDGLILEQNGCDPEFAVSATYEAAAGIKISGQPWTVINSVINDNCWVGAWADIESEQMIIRDSTLEDNYVAGVKWEISPRANEDGTCPLMSEVDNVTARGNGWNTTNRPTALRAEVLISTASCLNVHDSTFGDTGNHLNVGHTSGANFNSQGRVYAVLLSQDPSRLGTYPPGVQQGSIIVNNNTENGDQYKCYDADLTWATNANSAFAQSCN